MIYIVDFDRTITLQDSTDEIAHKYDSKAVLEFIELFRNKKVRLRDYFEGTVKLCKITGKERYYKEIAELVQIDSGFKSFMEAVPEFIIASAGARQNVEAILWNNGIKTEKIKIYANELSFGKEGISVSYPYDGGCGECGICKKEIVEKYKQTGRKIIYIGDGSSDICAAMYADYIFARNGYKLQKHCDEINRSYTGYDNFDEIVKLMGLL